MGRDDDLVPQDLEMEIQGRTSSTRRDKTGCHGRSESSDASNGVGLNGIAAMLSCQVKRPNTLQDGLVRVHWQCTRVRIAISNDVVYLPQDFLIGADLCGTCNGDRDVTSRRQLQVTGNLREVTRCET